MHSGHDTQCTVQVFVGNMTSVTSLSMIPFQVLFLLQMAGHLSRKIKYCGDDIMLTVYVYISAVTYTRELARCHILKSVTPEQLITERIYHLPKRYKLNILTIHILCF